MCRAGNGFSGPAGAMASHRGEQWRCPKRMRERVWSRQIERNATVRRDVAPRSVSLLSGCAGADPCSVVTIQSVL
jgi:hypothetical protein